jgi:ADP-ribosyl-[dinitrogen reductase] hydrolase
MLLEIAIGDAYGAGFEYADPQPGKRENDLSGYVKHPRHRLKPGSYTDDTQMSIALAEALVEDLPWTPLNLAQKFIDCFQRDPREGYASGFYHFLCEVADGEEFLARIRPDSEKSGAAMRVGVLGVLPSVGEVLRSAEIQAAITHNTPLGIAAAKAAALASHYCYRRLGPKADLGRFLEGLVEGPWSVPWRGKVKAPGWMSVRAAVTALVHHNKMTDVLRACIAYGGDVDTVAAIAMGPASCCDEIEQDLPDHLFDGLEDGAFGRRYLAALDARLAEKFPRD